MSRHSIPARPGFAVTIGWDLGMETYFAQVEDAHAGDDNDDLVLWLGFRHREVLRPEDLVEPLAPYATLTAASLAQLRADRAADLRCRPSSRPRFFLRTRRP
jgi:hypothetical protein